MIESLPVAIAVRAGVATLAVFCIGALILSLAERLPKGRGGRPAGILGRIAGAAAVCLVPPGFLSIRRFPGGCAGG